MQRQLDSFGLDYQWIEAVDAYDFSDTELMGVDREDKYQPTAMGCLLSHVKFYDRMIENNHPMACVLEDDVQLLPTFPDILNYEKLSKEDWNILLLAHSSMITKHLIKQYYKYFTEYFESEPESKPELDIITYYGFTLGVIAKKSHEKFIKHHYIAKPQGNMMPLTASSTMAYLIKLSTAKKFRKIAFANRKFIYMDEITRCSNYFKVSPSVITPPCARLNITYLNFSTITQIGKGRPSSLKDLPHQKLLQSYARNKWAALASFTFSGKVRIKLIKIFLINLKEIARLKMNEYLCIRKKFNHRVRQIKV